MRLVQYLECSTGTVPCNVATFALAICCCKRDQW